MYLSQHQTAEGPRWALDGALLPLELRLERLLQLSGEAIPAFLRTLPLAGSASGPLLAPVEPLHEVWAAGVTYLRSREAREAESTVKDVYSRVYEAERPELFWKAIGWRVVGHHANVRIRDDSRWNVPEPELTLVVNAHLGRELDFPRGVFLMTGTGIVPPLDFSMARGDSVRITIGSLTLENEVDTRVRAQGP